MSSQVPQGDPRSAPELVTNVISHVQTLFRQEVTLAKQQLAEAAKHSGIAVGLGIGAGVVGLFVIGFLGMAGGAALSNVVSPWLAWLIVAAVFLVIAAILGLVAKSQAERGARAPRIATDKIKEDVAWARQQIKR